MAFGAYPLVSLADARSKRDEAYSVLCEGRDPNVAKKLRIEENIEAWLSSLPGQAYANVRQTLVHTLNLAHLMPLSSVWAGPA